MSNKQMGNERDRETTEKRLLETVGQMVADDGFEKIGINAVSAKSGVSKILIYRYFGSLDGLIFAYMRKHDFWLNLSMECPEGEQLLPFVKAMFRRYIEQLRTDPVLRKLFRWELTCNNELIAQLREMREKSGLEMIRQVSQRTGHTPQDDAVVATLITASATYLAMLSDTCGVFNGIDLSSDSGWETITRGVDSILDKLFQ